MEIRAENRFGVDKKLYLSINQLTLLSENFRNLNDLKELWLGNNQLKNLPGLFGALIILKYLALDDRLISLPVIIKLKDRGCKITKEPEM